MSFKIKCKVKNVVILNQRIIWRSSKPTKLITNEKTWKSLWIKNIFWKPCDVFLRALFMTTCVMIFVKINHFVFQNNDQTWLSKKSTFCENGELLSNVKPLFLETFYFEGALYQPGFHFWANYQLKAKFGIRGQGGKGGRSGGLLGLLWP